MTLGQRIQELRKGAGLTQEQLAERMGVTRQAVSKWESDGGVPELDTLIAMSRLFHVTIGQLLGVEELRKSGGGSGEDGGQTQVGTGLHEAQVEAILRRYVEATRAQRQAPPSMYGKYGWKAPLLAVAGLAALMVLLGLFMNHVNSTIGNMRATLSNLQTTVWDWEYEISNIQSDIRQMQEEQNSLFSSLDSAVTGFDPERETVELELCAVLKTYTPRTQLQFVLAWVRADGTAGETASEWINGPEFRTRLELPMDVEVDADLRLQSADGIIQQQDLVLDLPGLRSEDFQLSALSLSGLYSIAVGMSGSATAENPVVVVLSPYPELFWPMSAQLTVTLNGEVLETTDLTLTEHERGVWYGQDGQGPRQMRLAQEDVLEFSLRLTDNLGREIVCSETVLGDEDAPRASQRIP